MYDTTTKKIAFCQTYEEGSTERLTILEYEAGASQQTVLCRYTDRYAQIDGGGYIYTRSYDGSDGSVRGFVCSSSSYTSSMKKLTESSLELLIMDASAYIKKAGVTFNELGFSKLPY